MNRFLARALAGLLLIGCVDQGASVLSNFSRLNPKFNPRDPQGSVTGPVLDFVSIPRQEAVVHRNGVRIGRTAFSTGCPEHQTPAGVFQILEKDVNHRSATYNTPPSL